MTYARTLRTLVTVLLMAASFGCSDDSERRDSCEPDDLDGVIGGQAAFVVTVTDTEFTPSILTAQNEAEVTVTLENQGTGPLGFFVECMPTPNGDGCPQESCFPEGSEIEPFPPGETREVTFEAPTPEGIYVIRASRDAEEPSAQFVVR